MGVEIDDDNDDDGDDVEVVSNGGMNESVSFSVPFSFSWITPNGVHPRLPVWIPIPALL